MRRITLFFMVLSGWHLFALAAPLTIEEFAEQRNKLVEEDVKGAGVKNPRVLESMRTTLRHEFVTTAQRPLAYYDMALPIGESQTISPPFVVAFMTESLDPQPTDRVLEIGTGSGYQAAVLSPLVKEVYTIEIVKPLGLQAAKVLKKLAYKNVFPKIGDGYQGWAEHAPFDKIIVTCSPENVPPRLVEQLKEGGLMIVPVGERYQQTLYLFHKKNGKLESEALLPTLFVPMTGSAEKGRQVKPDPTNPKIQNGGFEESLPLARPVKRGQPPPPLQPLGWHYQRQLRLMENDGAPEGKNYVKFDNATPGRNALALQGMALDGRAVKHLELSMWIRANGVKQGAHDGELPMLAITFFDENRAETGATWVGPWSGTFDWKQVTEEVGVPKPNITREAIVRIGLHGAVGEMSFDDVRLVPLTK